MRYFKLLGLTILLTACNNINDPIVPVLPQKAMYWTSPGEESISRSLLVDSLALPNPEILFNQQDGVYGPHGIIIDSENQKIYWTDYGNRQVLVSDLDGDQTPTVLYNQNDGITGPVGIALDPDQASIYWTEIPANIICRGSLDGKTPPVVIYDEEDGLRGPFAIEIALGQLYWVEHIDRQVMVASIDGASKPRIVYDARNGLFEPYDIEIDEGRDYLYILENTLPGLGLGDRIVRGSLDGSASLINIFKSTDGVNNAYTMSLDREKKNIYWINQLEQGAIWRGSLNQVNSTEKLVEDIYLGFGICVN